MMDRLGGFAPVPKLNCLSFDSSMYSSGLIEAIVIGKNQFPSNHLAQGNISHAKCLKLNRKFDNARKIMRARQIKRRRYRRKITMPPTGK